VKKSGELIPKKYFSTIYTLHHSIFLPSISSTTEKVIIRKKVVREYLQDLDPVQLLYLIHGDKDTFFCNEIE
jgi:hypothetical protein